MADAAAPKPDNSKFSFNIWPPSQRIRDAVIVRLSKTLSSSDSILSSSNLYQPVPADEDSSAARVIEDRHSPPPTFPPSPMVTWTEKSRPLVCTRRRSASELWKCSNLGLLRSLLRNSLLLIKPESS
uniref:WPP domain-containing protein n=1 Tax=Quercus lobata TaxID=97700 RepID=A0A7N2LY48_QUELO